MIVEQFDEHRRESIGGIGELTGLRGEVVGKGVEGPIGQAVAVEESERRHQRSVAT